jgi:hypothetical protein
MAESVASTSGRDTPTKAVVRIRPDQVAHGAFLRHFLYSVSRPNLVETVYAWGEATVETENLVLNNCCQWEVVKEFCEDLPHISITVFAHALVIKSVPKGEVCELSV